MSEETNRPGQQAQESSKKKTSHAGTAAPDYEARARDIRQKIQYLRSLRAKVEKDHNGKPKR